MHIATHSSFTWQLHYTSAVLLSHSAKQLSQFICFIAKHPLYWNYQRPFTSNSCSFLSSLRYWGQFRNLRQFDDPFNWCWCLNTLTDMSGLEKKQLPFLIIWSKRILTCTWWWTMHTMSVLNINWFNCPFLPGCIIFRRLDVNVFCFVLSLHFFNMLISLHFPSVQCCQVTVCL